MTNHFLALSAMKVGFFPLATTGFPNGSVHIGKECNNLVTEDGFRCLADGEVIAYRLDSMQQILRYDSERKLRYSLGFVLVRHRLALPQALSPAASSSNPPTVVDSAAPSKESSIISTKGEVHAADAGIYIYSLYSYNRPLARYPSDADGFLKFSLPFWSGARKYRVGSRAADRQVRPDAPADPVHRLPGMVQPVRIPDWMTELPLNLAVGLRVRAEGNGKSAIIGLLPHGCILTVRGTSSKGWAQIAAVERGEPLPYVFDGEVSTAAVADGWVYLDELDNTLVPGPVDTVVVLDAPYAVKAGALIGFMGENPGKAFATADGELQKESPVVALEVFAGDDFPAYLVSSRARAAALPDKEKTVLVIERGAKLCSDIKLPAYVLNRGYCLVPGPGAPTSGLFIYGTLHSARRQPKNAHPTKNEIRGNYVTSDGSNSIPEAVYERLSSAKKAVYTQRDFLLPAKDNLPRWSLRHQRPDEDMAIWLESPLTTADADIATGYSATFTATDLRALHESRFFTEPSGTSWWQVEVGGPDNRPIYAWVCSKDHPGTTWESPHAWPGFDIADGSLFRPLQALQRIVSIKGSVLPEDEATFSPAVNILGGSPLVVKLEEAIDRTGKLDGKVTAADIANARKTPWLARGLSRLITRFESQWSYNMDPWEALTPYMQEDWKVEMERQQLRGWWNHVSGKVKGFPVDPSVFHIHPLGWVDNFSSPESETDWFDILTNIAIEHEGGFSNHKLDPGGPTMFGISTGTWGRYAKRDLGVEPTTENLRKITIDDAKIIYRNNFWSGKGHERMSSIKLALMTYDWSITSGTSGNAVREFLTERYALHISAHGGWTNALADSLSSLDDQHLLYKEISLLRRRFYLKLTIKNKKLEAFLDGWNARVDKCEARDFGIETRT
jgi:lysozyme family protein